MTNDIQIILGVGECNVDISTVLSVQRITIDVVGVFAMDPRS